MEITKELISGSIGNSLSVQTARDLGNGYKIYPVSGKPFIDNNPAGYARQTGFQLVHEMEEDGIPFTRHIGKSVTIKLSCNENGTLIKDAASDAIDALSGAIYLLIKGDAEGA